MAINERIRAAPANPPAQPDTRSGSPAQTVAPLTRPSTEANDRLRRRSDCCRQSANVVKFTDTVIDLPRDSEQKANMIMRGDPRPSGYTWRRQTLNELMKLRRDLRVWCNDCGHEAVHSPVFFAMFGNVPYDITIWELAQKLSCRKCHSRRVGIEIKS
jgi:hypothetical protein